MKRYILLSLICLAGCRPSTRPESSELELAARAEWAFASASLGVTIPSGSPHSEAPDFTSDNPSLRTPAADDSPPPDEAAGDSNKPVVTAYAPEWKQSAREFLAWYDSTPPQFWDLQSFTLKVVRDEEPPESEKYPLFVWDTAQTAGWFGIESLIETVRQYPPNQTFQGKRDRKEKKNHDLVGVTASIPGAEILPLIIGDETTINRRSSTEQKIPLGYGANLVIPGEVSLSITQEGSETVAEFTEGTPKVLLPVLRKLWPVGVERLRLANGMLTVELDGWKDLQIKVLP